MRIPDVCYRHVVSSVREMCREKGVKVRLWKTKRYMGTECGSEAWFDADTRIVDVATKGRSRADVCMALLHESAHVAQWYNRGTSNDLWGKCQIPLPYGDSEDATIIVDAWVHDHWRYGMGTAYDAFRALYKLEAEAEEWAIHFARQLGLGDFINLFDYARGANAYLKSYVYTWHTCKFLPASMPPYTIAEIVGCQPTHIDHDWPYLQQVKQISAMFQDAYNLRA